MTTSAAQPHSPEGTDLARLLAGPLPVALAALACAWFVLGIAPVPDHAYQLHLARSVLDGAVLYVDVAASDMHPPLFTWLMMAVEGLARALGVDALHLFPAVIAGLGLCSLGLCWWVSARSPMVLAGVLLAVFPLSDAFFGQGEHIAVLCALPYLFAAARDVPVGGRGARAGLALLAALGMAMKPHFALVWVAVELYRARQFGWRSLWRLESVAIGSVFLLYLLATALLHPQFFALIPWLAELYPRFFPTPLPVMLGDPRAGLLLAAVVAAFAFRDAPEWTRSARMLALAALALFAAMLLQHKGWGYHWYPTVALSISVLGIALRRVLLRGAAVAVPLLAAVSLVLASGQALRVAHLLQRPPTELAQTQSLVAAHAGGRPVAALSQYIQAGFPLVGTLDVAWALPYAHLWMVRAIQALPAERAAHYRPLEAAIRDRIWEAIGRERPRLLLVERAVGPGIDMRAWFETDPRFRALFARATLAGTTSSYDAYLLAP